MGNLFRRFKLRKYQVTPQGGMIYVDRKVEKWLDSFKNGDFTGKSEKEIDLYRRITKSEIENDPSVPPPEVLPKISVVLVTYNSMQWMDNLKGIFADLNDWLWEIIVVDNGSVDGCIEKLRGGAKVSVIENQTSVSFAAAVNQGCRQASGELFLLINPDVLITRSALFSLVHFYHRHPDAAAIAPKLMLMRTPGFINGVGNVVGPFRHGYDLGLGHLDVGQFDDVVEVPSVCFATVLIPRKKWEAVGELDEGYPMYYEDSDWCYRARGMGERVLVDVKSQVAHGFRKENDHSFSMSETKLINITYSRLLYTTKLYGKERMLFLQISFALYDLLFFLIAFFGKNRKLSRSILRGRKNFFLNYSKIRNSFARPKKHIRFHNSRTMVPKIKEGIPVLKFKLLFDSCRYFHY